MDLLRDIVKQDEQVLERRIGNTTALHIASKFGHSEMVSFILEVKPEMVVAENSNSETPIHEACRTGHEKVVRLLMEKNQWVASKLNCENQSALFLACSYGHLNIVDFLLNHTTWLLDVVYEAACLHVSATKGRTVLISIIPFRKKPQKLILATAHKIIWVAISFMAVSYIAATWVVMPMPYNHQRHTITWTFEALLSICAGTIGFTFFGLLDTN
ncbi:hypothetical protein L1987_45216 [Smallanthus sonchifolius]|uniref:Uncharacterized protein n=1 Tax=Smallanthus sonchifolius TaxID=185202 RepID=A0ACB9GRG1_9ASTR|nr:hypothetical protein L1987_45216 [Smallanthus sonchifolius]